MIPPSLTASCDEQFPDPMTVLTTSSVAPDLAISERGRDDVRGTGSVLTQSFHVARVTRKSGWTWPTSQNTVVTRRPLACEKKIIVRLGLKRSTLAS